MSVKTRDWLKFGTLVAMAFALGLAFASAFRLPARGEAAVRSVLQDTGRPIPQAKAAVDLGQAFASVAEHVKPAVVFIRSERRERVANRRLPPGFEDFFQVPRRPQVEQGSGSGFIVSQDGYILTNNHVVQGADRVTVRLLDNREFTAKTIGTDPSTDVAVIKIQATGLPTVRLGDADSTEIGNWVLAIGNPLGENFTFTVTAGIVSAKGHVERAVMGISIRDADQEDAQAVGLPTIKGVVVRDYTNDDSPAKRAGIQPGDVIVAVEGQPVQSVPQLQQRVGFKKPGDVVQVTFVRGGGRQQTLPVRLSAPPSADREIAENDSGQRNEPASATSPLGISVQPLTQEDARDPDLRPVMRAGGALVVSEVSPDGPAYRKLADASSGYPDIVLKVNGQQTRTVAEFKTAVAAVRKGDVATLSVLRRTPDGWLGDIVRVRVP